MLITQTLKFINNSLTDFFVTIADETYKNSVGNLGMETRVIYLSPSTQKCT